jgi:hypothetical protein
VRTVVLLTRWVGLFILGWALALGTAHLALGQDAISDLATELHQPQSQALAQSLAQSLTQSLAQAPPDSSEEGSDISAGDGPMLRPFGEVVDGMDKVQGLFTIYRHRDKNQAYLALSPQQLNQNFLLIATLQSGVGEAGLFRGWPVNDFLMQFRKSPGNKIQIVIPNIYFRSDRPQAQDRRLLRESFSDSVIQSLNIVSIHPDTGELLIDLNGLILNRDPANLTGQYPWVLSNYARNLETSYLDKIQAFPENIEIDAIVGFSGGSVSDPLAILFNAGGLESIPDDRGFSLKLRYSLSRLPNNSLYHPRPADERVGYFVTAYRAPARLQAQNDFVRYIERWHLEKANPDAAISPPKAPIVFWLENTIPDQYREAIREGVLMWNQAFENAGWLNAIEVRQMPDNADWDPADVRYNVIRWSDSFGSGVIGFGPSRVNPLTGEILDADVILDANVIRFLSRQYEGYQNPAGQKAAAYMQLCGHRFQRLYEQWLSRSYSAPSDRFTSNASSTVLQTMGDDHHCAGFSRAQQMGFGSLMLETVGDPFNYSANLDTYVNQFLRALAAHEVGHTLGLRHNFLGSTLRSPAELNDRAVTETRGMVSSIMDYFPPNLAPEGVEQGDYFPVSLGPYDLWAIEYGYKSTNPLPSQAQRQLADIARQGSSPELAYATDEDIYDFIDPKADAWDLSSDPLTYARWQFDNAQTIWDKLDWYSLNPGEGYGRLRQRVDLIFGYYLRQAFTALNYVGGQRYSRVDPWDSRGQHPLTLISAAEQEQALDTLEQYVFAPAAFDFSPDLLNSLAPERWNHWGQSSIDYPLDYPIYDRILFIQSLVLSDLMFSDRLMRVRDAELKATDTDVLSLENLFQRIERMVWQSVIDGAEAADTPAKLSSLQRGLQRHHLTILTSMVLRRDVEDAFNAQSLLEFLGIATSLGTPEDSRVLARYQLRQLADQVDSYLNRHSGQIDITTEAHLEDVRDRIHKTLEAPLQAS